MPLKAGQSYNGHIENAALCYSNGGTLGLQIHLACEDGKISHVLWITDKTISRVEETLLKIGVSKTELQNEHAMENIGEVLGGRDVNFTTIAEEYKGEIRVKVQWLNKPRQDNGTSPAKMAAAMFGGGKPLPAPPPVNNSGTANEWGITDDDVPF